MLKQDVIRLYILLRKYRDHNKAIQVTADHYYYRVRDIMIRQDFFNKVTEVINQEINKKDK